MKNHAQDNWTVDGSSAISSGGPGSETGAAPAPGGIGRFVAGLVMVIAGAWLLMNQITVQSGFWIVRGHSLFGLTLLPFLFGIAILFFNGRSLTGILLTILGLLLMVLGVLDSLELYYRPTSLLKTLLMFSLLAGGIGLVVRTLMAPGLDRGKTFNE